VKKTGWIANFTILRRLEVPIDEQVFQAWVVGRFDVPETMIKTIEHVRDLGGS
jgi:hypothetical protein